MLYETGDADWYKSVPKMTTPETHHRPAKSQVVPHVRLAPMPDGRRRGLRRRAPSRHDETRLYLPAVTSLIARREIIPVSNDVAETSVRTLIDPKTRGTVMHAWFECIEWLDDSAPIPDEARLRRKATELTLPDAAVDRLLPEFYAAIQRPETRRVFEKNSIGAVASFAAFRVAIESGSATTRVERERTFALLHQNELVLGSIDRLVLLIQNGRPIAADIIDFKTDRFGGERGRWIEARRLHYGPQLEEYRFAVSQCFGVPIQHIGTRLLLIQADAVIAT
jgi:ATP-dependent helicase/nuclease subunit A